MYTLSALQTWRAHRKHTSTWCENKKICWFWMAKRCLVHLCSRQMWQMLQLLGIGPASVTAQRCCEGSYLQLLLLKTKNMLTAYILYIFVSHAVFSWCHPGIPADAAQKPWEDMTLLHEKNMTLAQWSLWVICVASPFYLQRCTLVGLAV